jgi:hypothetical protein
MQRASCGNGGAMESMESQTQAFHLSTAPWKSRPNRHSHIPTAPATRAYIDKTKANRKKNCGPWENGNPKPGFPLSHSPDRLRRKEKTSKRTLIAKPFTQKS